MKSEQTQERIIEQTILLIRGSEGMIEDVTIRKIAEQAKVGIGLINHYFGSKDQLIELCVQRIISNVVHTFKMENDEGKNSIELTKTVAVRVMDFLMENSQISKISILDDLKAPKENDNSIGTAAGFAYWMSGGTKPENYMKKAFFLVAILQESFLRKEVLVKDIGVDFQNKEQRDNYIGNIIEMLTGGEK